MKCIIGLSQAKHSLPMRFKHLRSFLAICALSVVGICSTIGPAMAKNKGGEAFNAGDYIKAASEWSKEAMRGDTNAAYNLGIMYEDGIGPFSRDVNQAMAWYLRAAQRGNLTAMVALARNQIAAGHPEAGVSWLNLAARWNDPEAATMLTRLKLPVPSPDLYLAKQQADAQTAQALGYALGCAIGGGCSTYWPPTPSITPSPPSSMNRSYAAPPTSHSQPKSVRSTGGTGSTQMCADGSFVVGTCTLAPDGSFVSGRPQMAPNGTFVGGEGKMVMCPDGSFVAGNSCRLMPNGQYLGQ